MMRAPGKYPERMLLDQLEYLYEVITTADFMPGQDAFDRYEELRIELESHITSLRRPTADC